MDSRNKIFKSLLSLCFIQAVWRIPIIDVNLPINSSTEEVKVKRAPADSVVNYMVRLLDQAAPDLPV
jgi:hypothetical protein